MKGKGQGRGHTHSDTHRFKETSHAVIAPLYKSRKQIHVDGEGQLPTLLEEGKIEGKRRENGISSSYQRKSEIKIIRPSSCELSSGNVIMSENLSTIWR